MRLHLAFPLLLSAALAGGAAAAPAVPPAPEAPAKEDRLDRALWKASWITAPGAPERDPVVLHLRKAIPLAEIPARFVVHVSADNRFVLHVNGRRVGAGPGRGDVEHWRYATYDLAPFLRPGKNLIAATVWNFGVRAPMAQLSRQTAFLVQGADAAAEPANTDASWETSIERGHAPNPRSLDAIRKRRFYFAAGPGERRDGAIFDWAWDAPESRATWQPAATLMRANPRSIREGAPYQLSPSGWMLVPDRLPPMEHQPIPLGKIVRTEGPAQVLGAFPESGRVAIPARSRVHILLDRRELTNAFPEIAVSGGRGATVRLVYAESLFDKEGRKGNRDEIEGKELVGLYDELVTDGGKRVFSPLAWRSWRYLAIEAETKEEPLVIDRMTAHFTGFPLALAARFGSDDPQLETLWQMAFRTLRISAHETYMDSPYWEQLQYVGDTRITALLSYVMSNEDRLARESIEHFDRSRTADGLTQSRYPTRDPQYIPPYSLFWVGMVHDFWMYRDDDAFVRARLPGTRAVIDWFLRRLRPDGLLAWIPFWSHVDPDAGGARQTEDGGSAAVTAQLLPALREAAALEEALGDRGRAALYRAQAQKIVVGLRTLWDPARGLLRDHPGATTYSHDANLLALWEGVMTGPARGKLLDSVLAIGRNPPGRRRERPEGEVVPASLYFRFYLHRALDRAGRGDELLPLLAPWREMLGLGLTTFPEFTDPTRSDSHAWTAHPAYDFLTILAGIRPGAPGFKRVRIAPALGTLGRLEATMPHPRGAIAVAYRRTGETIEAKVTLPPGLPGELVAGGKTVSLAAGETRVLTWRAPRAAAAPAPRAER